MKAVELGRFDAGSPEWHAARATGIGGSEIAAVMGLSPYESRFSLWHRKKGLVAPVEETDVMYWGKRHEPTICDEFAKRHPDWSVLVPPTYKRGIQIANPDRLLVAPDGSDELLEAKTARDDEGWGEPGTDQIPVHYRAQVLWYMDVLGDRRCHVAVLIGLSDYREYVVEYDAAEAKLMRDAATEFMRTLAANERPPIDGHNATYQTLRDLPEGLDAVDVEIPTALRDRFYAAQDAKWAASDELTNCLADILDWIGTGQRAVCERVRIATRTVRYGKTYQLIPARTRRNAQ